MTDRIIQVANLDPNTRRKNSNNLRVYFPKGIAACIHSGGGRVEMPLAADNRTEMKTTLRYAIGRSNDQGGDYGTSNFHANPYFACVTSTQWGNRGALIAEIRPRE